MRWPSISIECACALFLAAIVVFIALACSGCRSGSTYVEGTRFCMGVYVPWDGQLYGLQLMEYLNGAALIAPTNKAIEVSRNYAATNSYLGIVHTIEQTDTRAETR